MNGIDLSDREKFERVPTPADYFDREIAPETMELIKKNIQFLRECCNDVL